jgi:hypothetical protein
MGQDDVDVRRPPIEDTMSAVWVEDMVEGLAKR